MQTLCRKSVAAISVMVIVLCCYHLSVKIPERSPQIDDEDWKSRDWPSMDAVYTWVNGSDPGFLQTLEKYSKAAGLINNQNLISLYFCSCFRTFDTG